MKGYKLSTNYNLLWSLIHKGYRVPAWILYTDRHEKPIFDLVEVKLSQLKHYSIGTRGIGYESIRDGKSGFIHICKMKKVKFITPENKQD